VQKFSEQLVDQRLVHFVSTDAHGVKSRRPVLRPAFERLVERAGLEFAEAVCCHNPAQVATGREVVAAPTLRKARSGGWLSWCKAG